MEDYLFRPAYPILQVNLLPTRFDFQQRASDNSNQKWDIPVFMQNLDTNDKELIWLRKDGSLCNSGPTQGFRPSPYDTHVFNVKGQALLRVEYANELWSKLIEKAAFIDSTTQYTLVLDLLSGKISK